MRNPVLVLGVSFLAACGVIAPTSAFDPDAPPEVQAPTALSVTVVDGAGAILVNGLSVTADGTAADGPALRDVGGAVTTTAAADGTFRITGLPPGNQALRLSFPDHDVVEVPVVANSGTTSAIAPVTLLCERGVIFGIVDVTGAPDVSGVLVEAECAGVELRDVANNRAGPLCVTVELETSVLVAPLLLVDGENVEVVAVTAARAAILRVIFLPCGGPNTDDVQL